MKNAPVNRDEERQWLLSLKRSLEDVGGRILALIVDDNPSDAGLAAASLTDHGIASMLAATGDQAIQLVQAQKFSIAFLDWRMPSGRSGLETLRRLKALVPAMPVVVLTGSDPSENINQALESGAAAIMRKPLTATQITFIFEARPYA